MARVSLLATGGVLVALGFVLFAAFPSFPWFPMGFVFGAIPFLVGLGTLGAGLLLDPAGSAPRPGADGRALRRRLADLDALLADGTLKPAEHKRKRRQLLDEWGMPQDRSAC